MIEDKIMKKIVFMLGLLCALSFLVACGEMEPYEQTTAANTIEEYATEGDVYAGGRPEGVTPSESGWMVRFDSVDEMILSDAFPTAIVRVEVLDQNAEWVNTSLAGEESYKIVTISRALVLETFYGEPQPGRIIELGQFGGQIGTVRETLWRSTIHFEPGDDLIIVLDYGLTNSNNEPLPAFPVNHQQAIYRVSGFAADESLMAAARRRGGEQIELEAVHPENDLILTLGDLMRIAEQNDRR